MGLLHAEAYAGSMSFKCKVSQVLNSSVFEESVSADEYPRVELTSTADGQTELRVGAVMPWSSRRRDSIDVKSTADALVVMARRRIDHYYESSVVQVEVSRTRDAQGQRSGLLAVLKKSRSIKVAKLVCDR